MIGDKGRSPTTVVIVLFSESTSKLSWFRVVSATIGEALLRRLSVECQRLFCFQEASQLFHWPVLALLHRSTTHAFITTFDDGETLCDLVSFSEEK